MNGLVETLRTFTPEKLKELREIKDSLVLSVTTVDGTCVTVSVLEEVHAGLIVRREGGRIDLILWHALSHFQLSTIATSFYRPDEKRELAPGPRIVLAEEKTT